MTAINVFESSDVGNLQSATGRFIPSSGSWSGPCELKVWKPLMQQGEAGSGPGQPYLAVVFLFIAGELN